MQDLSAEQRQVGLGLVGVALLVLFAGLFDRVFDEVGFEAHDAAHAPFGVGHLPDEGSFVGSVGLVALAEFVAEFVEVGGVFSPGMTDSTA